MDVNDAMNLTETIARSLFEAMNKSHIACFIMKDGQALIIRHDEIWDYLKNPDKWIANC